MKGLREMKPDWKAVRDNELKTGLEGELDKYGEWERFNDESGFVILGKDHSHSDNSLLRNDRTRMTHPSTRYHQDFYNNLREEGFSQEEAGMLDYLQSLKGRILDRNNFEKDLEETKKTAISTADTLRARVNANHSYLNGDVNYLTKTLLRRIDETFEKQRNSYQNKSTYEMAK